MNVKSQRPSRAKVALVVLPLVALAVGSAFITTDAEAAVVKGRILVQPRAGFPDDEFDKLLATHGGKALGRIRNLDVVVVEVPSHASEEAVAALIAHNPHVKFAEPDRLVAPDLWANDSYYGSEWHLQTMQAPIAWDLSLGAGVTVAILDTGVDASHPDLQGQLVGGWNFYDNNSNTSDVYGHGTKVAGVVAAHSNNAAGVTAMAWNAKLMPLRVSDTTGSANVSTIASALTWAADHGAKVANISYGVHGSATVQAAAQYMKNRGGVVVNSAGNSGALDATPPSDTLITVAATGSTDTRASFSSWGTYVDLAAPGVNIWSTARGGGYAAVSGTSFSSPLTAGVVALMMAANPALAPSQIESLLKSTAVDLGTAGYDQYYGFGRVNAASAVQAAAQARPSDTQPPTVAIASPAVGASVKGLVTVDANASDNVGVSRVELYVNGALRATDAASPYGFSWDSAAVADGRATLVARAYDAAGNATNSSSVVVNVANAVALVADTVAPTVSIRNPANNSVVAGVVSISASAADNRGISNLSLYVDGELKSSGNVSSTSYSWNTKKVASGAHTISAVATDTSGNRSTSTISVRK